MNDKAKNKDADMTAKASEMSQDGLSVLFEREDLLDVEITPLGMMGAMHHFFLAESRMTSFNALLSGDPAIGRDAFMASLGLRLPPLWAELTAELDVEDTFESLLFYLDSEVLLKLFCDHELWIPGEDGHVGAIVAVDDGLLVTGWDMASLLLQVGVDLTQPSTAQSLTIINRLNDRLADARDVVRAYVRQNLGEKTVAQIAGIEEDCAITLDVFPGVMH